MAKIYKDYKDKKQKGLSEIERVGQEDHFQWFLVEQRFDEITSLPVDPIRTQLSKVELMAEQRDLQTEVDELKEMIKDIK